MPTPLENVTAFFAAYPEEGGRAAIRQWFTPGTIWVNEGVAIPVSMKRLRLLMRLRRHRASRL
ncbi:limonene-1,2-epoxide hydrolase family protein [Pseudomonas syringae pv. syringae]|nr:limonene-1,2-epoxide hydrolase family protein [Pseudomonas syringae]MDF5890244.1 limonene-1,2-epoxide hydrolase family protein [Pseudomonas syringae pv. syringae]